MGGTRRKRGSRRTSQTSREGTPTAAGKAAAADASPLVRAGRASQGIKPDEDEVVGAVGSLYSDELKPFGRILRKRLAERASQGDAFDALPDVDIRHLKEVCEKSERIVVRAEEGGDWSATLVGRPDPFVDIYSPVDPYPEQLWENFKLYFENLDSSDLKLPGGRYSCAQALIRRQLQFLAGYSLGQVCHMVQLAISQRKLLGYSDGSVVPYSHSQSMVKEQCASSQQPCAASTEPEAAPATWETARTYLRQILAEAATPGREGPPTVPLSNVKRLFRSRFKIELSETALGHSKLSELLQDERFGDICKVQLEENGYVVVQRMASPISLVEGLLLSPGAGFEGLPYYDEPRRVSFCPGEPLDVDIGSTTEGEPSAGRPPEPSPIYTPSILSLPTPEPSPLYRSYLTTSTASRLYSGEPPVEDTSFTTEGEPSAGRPPEPSPIYTPSMLSQPTPEPSPLYPSYLAPSIASRFQFLGIPPSTFMVPGSSTDAAALQHTLMACRGLA